MTTMAEMREVFTPEQAAEYLQVNRETIYRYIWDGRLGADKVGSRYRIPRYNVKGLIQGDPARDDATRALSTKTGKLENGVNSDELLTEAERSGEVASGIAQIRKGYQFRDEPRVVAFLQQNADLLKVLVAALDVLPQFFGRDASATLRVMSDRDYYPVPKLHATVRAQGDVSPAYEKRRRFDHEWVAQAMNHTNSRLLFTI